MPALPAEVPHLVSPENLPPGATMDPGAVPTQSANVGYLKELWHAIQTQDITGKDALLALTQRPLSTPDPENLNGGAPIQGAEVVPGAEAFRRRSSGAGSCPTPAPQSYWRPRRYRRPDPGLSRIHPFVGAIDEELVLPHR